MAVEYERLVAFFDGDVSGLKKSGDAAIKIVDDVEARFKKIKTDLRLTIDRASVSKIKNDIAALKFKDVVIKATVGKVKLPNLSSMNLKVNATVDKVILPSKKDDLTLKVKTLTIDASKIVVSGSNVTLPNGGGGGAASSGSLFGSVFGGNLASRGAAKPFL